MKYLSRYLIVFSILVPSLVAAQNYELAQVSVSPYEKSFTRAGKVAFKRTLNLSFKSSGFLKKLSVDEGEFFTQGQLLASLNTEELKADKNAKYSQLLQAKREVNRIKQLMERELSSEQELDAAQTHVDTVREAYQVAFYNLEKAEIYAPFDGVVLSRFSELAEFHAPGQQVLAVAATDKNLVVKVSLTDSEIAFVKLGQQVRVRLANLGEVNGVISKVPVVSNTDGQLYLIEVLLADLQAGQGVVAGQMAQVEINFVSEKFVYKVPLSALIAMDDAGNAILMTKTEDERFLHQTFNVLNMDNQFLYLSTVSQNDALDIVVNGWQQLKVSE